MTGSKFPLNMGLDYWLAAPVIATKLPTVLLARTEIFAMPALHRL
jgi:hypothetical protein